MYKDHQAYRLHALVASEDAEALCPISYVYDYLPYHLDWLKSQPISLSRLLVEIPEGNSALNKYRIEWNHSICLRTQAARLPLHTGLENYRQNKYWTANAASTKELLKLFADDRRCSDVMMSNRQSMSSLAEEQLESRIMDTYSRFSIYMFPEADEKRSQLLAQSVILIFMFDGLLESQIEGLRKDFVTRLEGTVSSSTTDTPLERRIDAIRQGLLAGDKEEGNGGAEVLRTLINFCHHPDPPCEGFSSVRDYLDYRWEDIANR
ncbi:MAG: hypothetical protein Q9166_004956 [cf. Caloplaca sp. 2 TL-2023]